MYLIQVRWATAFQHIPLPTTPFLGKRVQYRTVHEKKEPHACAYKSLLCATKLHRGYLTWKQSLCCGDRVSLRDATRIEAIYPRRWFWRWGFSNHQQALSTSTFFWMEFCFFSQGKSKSNRDISPTLQRTKVLPVGWNNCICNKWQRLR